MAKRKQVDRVLAVECGLLSVGDATVRLGLKMDRKQMPLAEIDEQLCGRRLAMQLKLAREGDPDQGELFDDLCITFDGVADVKRIGLGTDSYSFNLTFNRLESNIQQLMEFCQQRAGLTITSSEPIPEDAGGQAALEHV